MCGYEFDQTALSCHVECPLAEGCAIICCPNCGYQVVDESKSSAVALAQKMQKVFKRWTLAANRGPR
ncbi:MAG: hypothetical protein AB1791_13650 [Chloroflexota bacterium]